MTARILACLMIILIGWSFGSAHAQRPRNLYENYDVLTGQKTIESRFTQGNSFQPGVYTTQYVTEMSMLVNRYEVSFAAGNYWIRRTQNRNESYYQEEFLTRAPFDVKPGQNTFGYITLKDRVTDAAMGSWPIFLAVSDDNGNTKMVYTIYLPFGNIKEITRIHAGDNYFFPRVEEEKIFKAGVDPNAPEVKENPSAYLEKHVVIRRVD